MQRIKRLSTSGFEKLLHQMNMVQLSSHISSGQSPSIFQLACLGQSQYGQFRQQHTEAEVEESSTSPSYQEIKQLVGHNKFQRHNPKSDKFNVKKFHHLEFWCQDATNTYKRFQVGLGMQLIGKSDLSTGNNKYASYILQSNNVNFVFTAPYAVDSTLEPCQAPIASYSQQMAHQFVQQHGLAVRAVGLHVGDAELAYSTSVANGAVGIQPPVVLTEKLDNGFERQQVVSEVQLYGDVVLRYISGDVEDPRFTGYEVVNGRPICYGLRNIDHCVGNVHNLLDSVNYIIGATGFHEFAEFTAEDVGTVDSGLNSMVLANNSEHVLLPVNEPTFGTARRSQIQTYLEANKGPGVQHVALQTDNIFETMREMRERSDFGGFEFMARPSEEYYKSLPEVIGDALTSDEYKQIEELGLLADRDDQGVLLQVFTQPLGDRPTFFLEIIQRVCHATTDEQTEIDSKAAGLPPVGGCGGFGKGNFTELFKSIEEYERTLKF